jgi:Na+/H+ antiporter NhaD/arsenite permease-like protein
LLLARQFYALKPPAKLAYATLGLLFVNVSVGGVLTHFAAPPVLMVAGTWGWDTPYMFKHFGIESLMGIAIANTAYFFCFRGQFKRLATVAEIRPEPRRDERPVPIWVTIGHLLFMGWTVMNAHYPALVIGGFLFFLAFYEVTVNYQSNLVLRSPILVGFFLAGLVIHGGLQQWWIEPVLGRLSEVPLMLSAIGLTAFNDNAAITYLSTLVPGLTEGMKYAVVAGAVTGGGLTVIANAPNPAGQAILAKFFPDGISPLRLLLGALPATVILALCFLLLR